MGLARTHSVALVGIEGRLVEVEAHIAAGLPKTVLVGLPDASLAEARDRCRAAVVNSGQEWPNHRVTVGLSPASLPKAGSHFDLAIACAVLTAAGVIPPDAVAGVTLLGELGLDGRLRSVRGVLPAALAAVEAGFDRVVVPEPNAREAALVPGLAVIGARSLAQVTAVLRGQPAPLEPPLPAPSPSESATRGAQLDLADVLGQPEGRHTVEVAAAGGHHILLEGPPGAGKTMLAERLPGLLPDLDWSASLEATAVHSVAGVLPGDVPLVRRPPYLDPHHTASVAAVVGGGSRIVRPGAISLAHRGVLFLDEAPEFHSDVLEALRQPLERGEIVISRAGSATRFPARFLLVLAANPCPCGRGFGQGLACECTPTAQRRYRGRLSGPLRDRIDLHRAVHPVTNRELHADRAHLETTDTVAARVRAARERQQRRFAETPWRYNGEVPGPDLRRRWPPEPGAMDGVERHLRIGAISARGADRVLRVAWTVADLAGRSRPTADDVGAAMVLRTSGQLPGQPARPARRVG